MSDFIALNRTSEEMFNDASDLMPDRVFFAAVKQQLRRRNIEGSQLDTLSNQIGMMGWEAHRVKLKEERENVG